MEDLGVFKAKVEAAKKRVAAEAEKKAAAERATAEVIVARKAATKKVAEEPIESVTLQVVAHLELWHHFTNSAEFRRTVLALSPNNSFFWVPLRSRYPDLVRAILSLAGSMALGSRRTGKNLLFLFANTFSFCSRVPMSRSRRSRPKTRRWAAAV